MSENRKFIDDAQAHIKAFGHELDSLEAKLKDAGESADAWSSQQAAKLRQDWEKAKSEVGSIVERIETDSDDALNDARQQAQNHWDALKAAVKTYRDHVENTDAS